MAKREKRSEEEKKIQARFIKNLKAAYKGIVIRVSHISDFPMHDKTERQIGAIYSRLRAQGHETGMNDITIVRKSFDGKYGSLNIELKTKKEDPFRISKGGYWIETNRTTGRGFLSEGNYTEKGQHVILQRDYLGRAQRDGGFSCFAAGYDQVWNITKWYLTGEGKEGFSPYSFSVLDGDFEIMRLF